ncbi:hypothetical protein [Methylobacterium nodulans]|uniref:Uncharacterized protein n=1 Tax=Methylobacterium nodulans (strain LMG 21967 / CNCM I-2342 / ORS 2060) TaxID=460265 RepID=B8IDS9_METNO|nr:hypothetical protein [Methylobacterium nodulans]ACL55651.1 hypothetical protein Mnod_0615 [Methylobacterium nodulans ORS 2060]
MTTQAFPRRVVVTASLLSCAPRPGSPEAPAFAALLADEADYLLRRYGTAQRGLTDEAAEERDYLAAAAQDLQALADLYRGSPTPYRDDPRAAPPAGQRARLPVAGHLLIAVGEGRPTSLFARG